MSFNYALLERVKAHFIAEPRRLQMDYWQPMSDEDLNGLPEEQRPPCGTACCIGGTIEILENLPAAPFNDMALCVKSALNPARVEMIDVVLNSLFFAYPKGIDDIEDENDPWFGESDTSVPAACRAIDRAIVIIKELESLR